MHVQLKKMDLQIVSESDSEYVILQTDFGMGARPAPEVRVDESSPPSVEWKTRSRFRLSSYYWRYCVQTTTACSSVHAVATYSDPVRYASQTVGHNLLGCMMELLSKSADLSKRYTSHCVRAATVTLLKQQGVEDRKVCNRLQSGTGPRKLQRTRRSRAQKDGQLHGHESAISKDWPF